MPNNPPPKALGYIDGVKRKGRLVRGFDPGTPDGDREVRLEGRIKGGKLFVDRALSVIPANGENAGE